MEEGGGAEVLVVIERRIDHRANDGLARQPGTSNRRQIIHAAEDLVAGAAGLVCVALDRPLTEGVHEVCGPS
jgi:hypothetical protein